MLTAKWAYSETCNVCGNKQRDAPMHAQRKYCSARCFDKQVLQVRTKFGDDEANSPTQTVMLMKVGGRQGSASSGMPSASPRWQRKWPKW